MKFVIGKMFLERQNYPNPPLGVRGNFIRSTNQQYRVDEQLHK